MRLKKERRDERRERRGERRTSSERVLAVEVLVSVHAPAPRKRVEGRSRKYAESRGAGKRQQEELESSVED